MSLSLDGRGQRGRDTHCARQGAMIVDQRISHVVRKNLAVSLESPRGSE